MNQMQVIHIQYKKLFSGGRVPPLHEDAATSCHLWASEVLGRLISTLKACSPAELNVLHDTINGKPSKVHAALRERLTESKTHPDAWINSMMKTPRFGKHAEAGKTYTVETIPWVTAYAILKMEECRSRGSFGNGAIHCAGVPEIRRRRRVW